MNKATRILENMISDDKKIIIETLGEISENADTDRRNT